MKTLLRSLPWRLLAGLLLALTAPGWMPAAPAQEMPVPVEVQVPLFLKVLSLDRNLMAETGSEVVIGVVYQQRYRPSLLAKDAFVAAVADEASRDVLGRPARCVPIAWRDGMNWEDTLAEHGLDVLYVAPLRAADVADLVPPSRTLQINTLTSVPLYVNDGLGVGVTLQGRRPQLLVNLAATRAEGAAYDARLLRLATVVE